MELTNTSFLLLGMVALAPLSGYDIKQMADGSTRHFWQISYGQIYPELKALEKAGMVQGAEAARGSRQRTLHQLTDAGAEALTDWDERIWVWRFRHYATARPRNCRIQKLRTRRPGRPRGTTKAL